MKTRLLIALTVSLVLWGCDKDDEFANAPSVSAPPADSKAKPLPVDGDKALPIDHPPLGNSDIAQAPAAGALGFADPSEFGVKGPLRWKSPEGWTASKPASSMRLAEYVVSGVEGSQPASVSIFYFGASGGGGIEANVSRWVGQFTQTDGRASSEVALRETKMVNGMNVHLVSVSGTFNAGMSGNAAPQGDQKMRGAIVESSAGLFFFKMVGPTATVDGPSGKGFDALVDSFAPGS